LTEINKRNLKLKFKVFYILFALFCCNTNAAYNNNIRGEVKDVYVYTDHDAIYFRFKNQPTSHDSCKPTYFVISASIPENRRNQLLSRLLLAKASKENINIGFDSIGDCANGYIRVHRVG